MLIATGTKRSGTSMWMQVLIAAGFSHLGEKFSGNWEKSIREANPRGFFESMYRQGIYFVTNPHPETGQFIHPRQVKRHVVKVFIPGLIRTDYAYIGPVIASMRNWREYCASLKRLYNLEDAFRDQAAARGEALPQSPFPDEATESLVRAGRVPPALEWWFENYDLIRDFATRRYPMHMTTYDRMLRDPEKEVTKVLEWLGEGDLKDATRAIEPKLRTQADVPHTDALVEDHATLFDELYAAVDSGGRLDAAFVRKLNETNETLSKRWKVVAKERLEAARKGVERSAPGSTD